ncbi:hypothetical protein KJ819_01675 [Patescibacteria group bacterium]|nr:hypothetical protein [Patescibacteria group bacterium]MBU1501006.1 hypothetical protein [Patescibacteria group bacterium]MBU2080636.1 hypothetical protein [Patescibacteria group bacterium]MBU2124289.1 hypothetical protein [Patescibacteria group bacterium]MBU2194415.1 hypothetical protein [Patescibacteria group bacterium]
MFREIDQYKIKVRDGSKNTVIYVPNIISMDPLEKLFDATNWLFGEALEDFNKTHTAVKSRRNEHGYSQENIDDIDRLGIRLGSRTQGYVNQLCLMEDILIFEYDRMSTLLKEASAGQVNLTDDACKTLKKRFKPVRTFRNKVIAHTAYTYSFKDDNPETIVRSILNLFPGPTKVTLGDNFFSGFSPHVSQLPVISIFEWEEIIKPIFQDWKTLFIKKLEEVQKMCPIVQGEFTVEP